jgi:hypothetical protein
MAYRQKISQDTTTSIPGGVPTIGKVISLIKQQINHQQFDFYELETFEVTKVLLDYEDLPKQKDGHPNYSYYGAVAGRFVINKSQSIKPEDGPQLVRPLDPKIKNYPVVGELVVVGNYNGKSYYWNTLNTFNLVNENSVPGISYIGTGESPPTALTKFGKRFERNGSIRQVKAEEGDLILHGRFGNSINLGSNDNSPVIKIRSGQRTDIQGKIKSGDEDDVKSMKNVINRGGPIPEDINKDKNSIYLSTGKKYIIRNSNSKYKGQELIAEGNSIIINSDKLIFNGRNGNVNIRASKNLYLEGDEVFINAGKGQTIKMGDPRAVFVPTVRGDVLLEFQSSIMKILSGIQSILVSAGAQAWPKVASDAKSLFDNIKTVTEVITKQTFLNKQVMTADPNIKIPDLPKIPELPELPTVELPDIPKPDISGVNVGVNMEDLETIEKLNNL